MLRWTNITLHLKILAMIVTFSSNAPLQNMVFCKACQTMYFLHYVSFLNLHITKYDDPYLQGLHPPYPLHHLLCILLTPFKKVYQINCICMCLILILIIQTKKPIASWVGTNSGMDYWNGILDWTTGLSYFPFLDKFLNSFFGSLLFMIYSICLLWMIVITTVTYCSVFIMI